MRGDGKKEQMTKQKRKINKKKIEEEHSTKNGNGIS